MSPHLRFARWAQVAVLLGGSLSAPAAVYINEFMADNPGRPNDPNAQLDMDGKSPGWIELRNNGASAVTLTGWALSDDPANPGKWIFAAPVAPATVHTTIAANGTKLVFCGGIARNVANVEPHTDFKIDDSGVLLLSQPDGSGGWRIMSQIGAVGAPYPSQRRGISYGLPGNDPNAAPVFFESDTPNASNAATGVTAFCKDTKFSVDRGFYDAPFTLTITSDTPGATIAWTVDGTLPSASNGTQAAAPDAATPPTATVSITGTTIIRARAWMAKELGASNVDTQTYIFPSEVLTQTGPLPSMGLTANDTAPWGTSGGSPRSPAGPDWAVETGATQYPNVANRFTADDVKTLPVVSVVTAWREAFGPNTSAPDYASTPVANRGFYVGAEVGVPNEGTDRFASFEYINPLGDPANPNAHRATPDDPWVNKGFQVDGNVHVFGGTSQQRWKSYKLSMRFKAETSVNFPLYGDEGAPSQDLFVLDARLNQAWVHATDAGQRQRGDYVRDHVMSDLQNEMNGLSFHTQPVHLFLNGLYWGLYLLHEKPDEKFMADYRGGSQDDWDVFKHSAVAGVDGAANAFAQVIAGAPLDPALALGSSSVTALNPVSSHYNCTTLQNYEALLDLLGLGRVAPNPAPDLTTQAAYEAVAAKLDMDEFIDYILLNVVGANQDWPHKNYYASYKRTDPEAKWRFHSWDAEHVFRQTTENTLTAGNFTGDVAGPGAITRKLAVNAEFRLRFADLAHRRIFNGGVLSVENMQAVFGERLGEIEPAGVRGESARWGDNRSTAGQPYSYTTNGSFTTPTWTAEKTRILNTILPVRGSTTGTTGSALVQMRAFTVSSTAYPLYPTVTAPDFRNNATSAAQHGGSVPAGFVLKINNGNAGGAGTVYFTLDGSDPRQAWTGAPSPTAQVYSAAVALGSTSKQVKARVLNGSTWSALADAFFSVESEPASAANVVVSKLHYNPAPASQAEIDAGFPNSDDFEFLELMNIGSKTVALDGVHFGAGLDCALGEESLLREIPVGGRVFLVKKVAAFEHRYGTGLPIAAVFENLSGLANGGERLELLDRNGVVIRDFTYNDKVPWPTAADGTGAALVLVRPESSPDHSLPENWRASTAVGSDPDADDRVGYDAWKASAFLPADVGDDAVSGPAADPDGDGVANLFEYLAGSDPRSGASVPEETAAAMEVFDAGNGDELFATVTFRIVRAAEGATLEASTSTTLASWSSAPADIVHVRTHDYGDGTAAVTYRAAVPLSQDQRRFFRGTAVLSSP